MQNTIEFSNWPIFQYCLAENGSSEVMLPDINRIPDKALIFKHVYLDIGHHGNNLFFFIFPGPVNVVKI